MNSESRSADRGTVYLVDDDEQARRGVRALLSMVGAEICEFESAEQFLDAYDGRRPACLLTDVRMLGMSGLELQEELIELGIGIAVVVITAFANTATTVRAMRNGALTLLEKPCTEDVLWNVVRDALKQDRQAYQKEDERSELRARVDTLTPKEQQILKLIVEGDANKVMAQRLEVSVRTVENHRRRVFEKMGAESLAELVKMSMRVSGETAAD